MSLRARSVLFLVTAAVLWSTSGLFLKSMPSVHWIKIAGLRSLFAAILFLPGILQPRPPARKLMATVITYAVMVGALMGSMQLGTAAQGIWLQYIAPALVALWAWGLQRQRLRAPETATVILTVIAIIFIVTGESGRAHQQSVLLGLISGLAFGTFIILLKSMENLPPARIFVWTNLGTAAALLPVAAALGVPLATAPRELVLLAAMGLVQLALPYYFFPWGLSRTRAVEASLIILLEPILNPILVYFVFGEIPAPKVILGCALIAVGLIAMALFPNRRGLKGAAEAPSTKGGG